MNQQEQHDLALAQYDKDRQLRELAGAYQDVAMVANEMTPPMPLRSEITALAAPVVGLMSGIALGNMTADKAKAAAYVGAGVSLFSLLAGWYMREHAGWREGLLFVPRSFGTASLTALGLFWGTDMQASRAAKAAAAKAAATVVAAPAPAAS